MHYSDVEIDVVDVPKGRRAINQKTVDFLAESMAEIGLQNPIAIWSPDDFTADLVTGHHRLLAAKKLGWAKIDCMRLGKGDEGRRELWEIDENLIERNCHRLNGRHSSSDVK